MCHARGVCHSKGPSRGRRGWCPPKCATGRDRIGAHDMHSRCTLSALSIHPMPCSLVCLPVCPHHPPVFLPVPPYLHWIYPSHGIDLLGPPRAWRRAVQSAAVGAAPCPRRKGRRAPTPSLGRPCLRGTHSLAPSAATDRRLGPCAWASKLRHRHSGTTIAIPSASPSSEATLPTRGREPKALNNQSHLWLRNTLRWRRPHRRRL